MGFTINTTGAGTPLPNSPAVTLSADPIEPFFHLFTTPLRIQLIGLTGSGKTTLSGELIDFLFQHYRQRTIYFNIDRGTPQWMEEYVKRNIVLEYRLNLRDPFIWIDRAAKGLLPVGDQWVPIPPAANVGLVVFDSGTGVFEEQLQGIRHSQATALPIGPKAYSFAVTEGDQDITVGTVDKSHYGIVQGRIVDAMWESQKLPYHVIWTANIRLVDRDKDGKLPTENKEPVLGADLGGRALAGISARWFTHTFSLIRHSQLNSPNIHRLYVDAHLNQQMGMNQVIGNARVPLRGGGVEGVEVPQYIEPASLVRALSVLARRQESFAKDMDARFVLTDEERDLKRRLGI